MDCGYLKIWFWVFGRYSWSVVLKKQFELGFFFLLWQKNWQNRILGSTRESITSVRTKQQSMQTWFSWIDFSSLAIWYRHKVSSMYTRRGRCFCKCMNHTRIVQVAPYLSLKVIVLWNSILFTRMHNIEIHIVRSTDFISLKSCAINIVQFLKFNGRPISHPIRKGTVGKSILAVHILLLKLIS